MICNKCNHELPDDSKFCQYCGSKLETGFVISGEALNELSEENADIQTNIKEKDLVEEVNEDMTQEEAVAFEKKKNFIKNLLETKKKVESNDQKQDTPESPVSRIVGPVNITALLKRGFLALEDGEWKRADDFFEQCLNENAELAEAYLGKLMAELHVKTQNELLEQQKTFDSSSNYQRVLRFNDEAIKEFVIESNELVKERIFEESYKAALNLMERAKTKEDFLLASEAFAKIGKYKNALVLADKCKEKAENVEKDILYRKAQRLALLNYSEDVEEARKIFVTLGDWRDSKEATYACVEKFKKLRQEEQKENKIKSRIFAVVLTVFFSLLILILCLGVYWTSPSTQYGIAVKHMNNQNYEEAIAIFQSLGDYEDSTELRIEAAYLSAVKSLEQQQYSLAAEKFIEILDYKDSATLEEKARLLNIKNVDVMEKVVLGNYVEGNTLYNGLNLDVWTVIAREENRVLLLKYERVPNQDYSGIFGGWKKSTLRKFLNEDFYKTTFSENLKKRIVSSKVDEGTHNTTSDKIFILSKEEIEKYLPFVEDRKVIHQNQYICDNGGNSDARADNETTNMLLRYFAYAEEKEELMVLSDGLFQKKVATGLTSVTLKLYTDIYPAMWIDVSGIE